MAARSALNIELSRFIKPPQVVAIRAPYRILILGGRLGAVRGLGNVSISGALDNRQEVYQLSAIGRCQVGDSSVQRVIEVGLRK